MTNLKIEKNIIKKMDQSKNSIEKNKKQDMNKMEDKMIQKIEDIKKDII